MEKELVYVVALLFAQEWGPAIVAAGSEWLERVIGSVWGKVE